MLKVSVSSSPAEPTKSERIESTSSPSRSLRSGIPSVTSHDPLIHADFFHGFERSQVFEQLYERLHVLEKWKELAIRPASVDQCDPEDLDLFHRESDDIDELQERCNKVRATMNENLPAIETIVDLNDSLIPKPSSIPGAGLGLFYVPQNMNNGQDFSKTISKGTIICFYTGHLQNIQSSRKLVLDKSYLMMVQGDNLVDPGPCRNIKARYINDPLNEKAVNCQFIPNGAWRSAVVTTRNIEPGEEFFVSYGDMYWSQHKDPGKQYAP